LAKLGIPSQFIEVVFYGLKIMDFGTWYLESNKKPPVISRRFFINLRAKARQAGQKAKQYFLNV